jgi:alcohol dehydrogenase class IV
MSLSDVSPELAEVEQYYSHQVDKKLAQLANFKNTEEPYLQKDLQELDQWMRDLQKDLSLVPKSKKEAVINEIIDLYKTKLAILESVLTTIQSSNQNNVNSNQDETVDI